MNGTKQNAILVSEWSLSIECGKVEAASDNAIGGGNGSCDID